MEKKLCWGIAAAGRITHDFVNALTTIDGDNHVVVAVADVEEERAKDFALRHNIPKYYDSFEKLAKDNKVQIVYVGTINPFHYAAARVMLEQGKHVLCEKPLCLHYNQAEELYRLAKEKNVFLMEGMWSRFFPSYQRLRNLLATNAIGNIKEIVVEHGFCADSVERILTRSLGGSITLDIGLYAIQLAQLVFNESPIDITAKGALNNDNVDVETEFTLNYGNDRKLHAFVSARKNLNNTATITGTKGQIKLYSYWCCTSLYVNTTDSTENFPLPEEKAKFPFNHTNSCGLRYEAEQVRDCIAKGLTECPLYTHKQSLELLKTQFEILKKIGVSHAEVTQTNL